MDLLKKLTTSLEKIAKEKSKQQSHHIMNIHKQSAASSINANIINDVKLSKKNSIYAYLE